jgi:hypothetical protein
MVGKLEVILGLDLFGGQVVNALLCFGGFFSIHSAGQLADPRPRRGLSYGSPGHLRSWVCTPAGIAAEMYTAIPPLANYAYNP